MTSDELERCYNYYIKHGGNGGRFNLPPAVIKSLINQHINNYLVNDTGDITLHDISGRFIKTVKRI
tara:strand:+ start:7594 stop:7791 length:198 start_codon:yes stop_codon:yes gene_type:complete